MEVKGQKNEMERKKKVKTLQERKMWEIAERISK